MQIATDDSLDDLMAPTPTQMRFLSEKGEVVVTDIGQ